MELKQLEYFQMTSRLKNITRAAKRLSVSQPNITVAIKKLEAELGIQLFERSQKQLSLTPEGQVFLNRIEQGLRNIQDAVLEVNDYRQLQKGTIKIGIPSMIGAYLFPKIFSGFQKKFPHLDIYLYEKGSMLIRESIDRDELDFGIVIISNASPTLELLPMSKNRVLACVPKDHPLAEKKSIAWTDLSTTNLIMLKDGSFISNMIREKLKNNSISPNIVLESDQIETIKGLISSNVGIAFLLDFVVQDAENIVTIPLEEDIWVDVGLAWKKERYISKAAQSFINFCQITLNEEEK